MATPQHIARASLKHLLTCALTAACAVATTQARAELSPDIKELFIQNSAAACEQAIEQNTSADSVAQAIKSQMCTCMATEVAQELSDDSLAQSTESSTPPLSRAQQEAVVQKCAHKLYKEPMSS